MSETAALWTEEEILSDSIDAQAHHDLNLGDVN